MLKRLNNGVSQVAKHCPSFRVLAKAKTISDVAPLNIPTRPSGPGYRIYVSDEERTDTYIKRMGLGKEKLPNHVTLSLDGNRTWSKLYCERMTYEPFYRTYMLFAQLCVKLGIPVATAWLFCTDNFRRSREENILLFTEFQESIESNVDIFIRKGIKVSVIGERWRLPKSLQDAIKEVEEATSNCTKLDFMYAIPYGGRSDMLEATKEIISKVMAKEIEPNQIDEEMVEKHLFTGKSEFPCADLMIRGGGKYRIANFYLWQAAYAELYFVDTLPADFWEAEFIDALRWFQHKSRRFGK